MRRFAALWPDAEKVPSVMAQIGWTAHRVRLDAFADDLAIYAGTAPRAPGNRWPMRRLMGDLDLDIQGALR
jgi:hypothetical protein